MCPAEPTPFDLRIRAKAIRAEDAARLVAAEQILQRLAAAPAVDAVDHLIGIGADPQPDLLARQLPTRLVHVLDARPGRLLCQILVHARQRITDLTLAAADATQCDRAAQDIAQQHGATSRLEP